MLARTLIIAAVLTSGMLAFAPEAEAAKRGRRGLFRSYPDKTFSLPRGQSFSFKASASARRRVDYNQPHLHPIEKRFAYRRQAFFDHAFNGFSPYDFR